MSKQIYFLTGSKGSGKTTGTFSFLRVSDYPTVFYIDTEDSASDILRANKELGLELGKYVRAYERLSGTKDIIAEVAAGRLPWVNEKEKSALIQYFDWLKKMLNTELTAGKFTTLIMDTIEPVEAAITAYVEVNKQKAGWSGDRSYGRMETEGVRPILDNLFEGIHQRGVQRIILTSHVKPVWMEKKPILNKVEPGGRLALWSRISSCMFWLVPNYENEDGAPAALVLKARFGNREIDKETGFVTTRRVLPQRMPRFSYADILEYKKHPANLKNPQPGEVPTLEEKEMMSEFLNDAQMRLMVLGLEQGLAESNIITPSSPVAMPGSEALSLPELIKRRKANGGTE